MNHVFVGVPFMKRFPLLLALILLGGVLVGAFAATKSEWNGGRQTATPAIIETDGTLDQQFVPGKITNGLVLTSAPQPDGKVLIGGQFSKVRGVTRLGIARLNADGTLDFTFQPVAGTVFDARNIVVQTDGKILVGTFLSDTVKLVRLNSDGSLDSSFNPSHTISTDGNDDGFGNATSPGQVNSFLLEPDGKVIVAGYFAYIITSSGVKVARNSIARFNGDGSFDASFNPGAGAVYNGPSSGPGVVYFVKRQNLGSNTGKIIVQGEFYSFDNNAVPGMARLNPDGSFDNTFFPGNNPTATDPTLVFGLFIQADDRIIVSGTMTSYDGYPCDYIVRLDINGGRQIDFFDKKYFGNNFTTVNIQSVAQQSDGKLIVAGAFHQLDDAVVNNVVRLELADGARDATFDGTGAGVSATGIYSVLVRPSDDKIFLGGYFSTYGGATRNNFALANADGTVDPSFEDPDAADYAPEVYALAVQADGKILVGGFYTSFNGITHYNLVRLNPDSTVDPSFNVELGTTGAVRAILVQPDGKIVIGGAFIAVNGVFKGRIARLNSDGTLDTSFDTGYGANDTIYALAQDSAGNIYAGGAFRQFGTSGAAQRFVKLGPTGALDSASAFVTGPGRTVYAIVGPDSSGRIVIGGEFTTYRGAAARGIVRVDVTNLNFDSTFNHGGTGFNGMVRSLLLAPDGTYYVGGHFVTYNGVSRPSLARLNSDGSLDATFVPAITDSTHYALALQNGKLIVAGDGSPNPPSLVRLTSTGAIDSSFNVGSGVQVSPSTAYAYGFNVAEVDAVTFQADGKLLLGGRFNQYNGVPRSGLARLTAAGAPDPSPIPTATASPSPTAPATATATATATPTATATATATATPTATPGSVGNVSTRLPVGTGDNALIEGFIVDGPAGSTKKILVRAIGPSLKPFGVADALANPTLEIHDSTTVVATNNDWKNTQLGDLIKDDQSGEINSSGLKPGDDLESAIIADLAPGSYTAVVRGVNDTTGTAVVDAYDLSGASPAKLANIATRGFIQGGDKLMIAGFIVQSAPVRVVIRAIGPSLLAFGINNALPDTTLELHNANGEPTLTNDDWKSDQQQELENTGLNPSHDLEAAMVKTLPPGQYTAWVQGKNGASGIGVVQVYFLE
jgi:uncharacterized delta-60 repeat protein